MAKISGYPETTTPDPEMFIALEPDEQDQRYKTHLGNLSIFPFRNKMNKQWNDFDGGVVSQNAPFTSAAIAGGTFGAIAQEANHPGIWRIASAAGANSGHYCTLGGTSSVLIGGSEVAEFIFRCPTTTAIVEYFGFIDNTTAAAPTDGVTIIISGTTLLGRNFNNTAQSSTGTSYAISANTWYRAKIEVNSGATLVTYTLYDSSGAVLWTDTLSTNIPTAAGRETGFGALAYKTSVGAANILDLDWMAYYNNKALVR